jgi:hemoglobin-like flavoprotein
MTGEAAATLMEATLIAVAEADIDITPALFERFFAAFPEQRRTFTNLGAASGRMTSETIEAMIGLATDEHWVPVTIAHFVDLHRNYGKIPHAQYAAFVDMTVDALADAAGTGWCEAQARAWRTQAARLNAMIAQASNRSAGLAQ